jgi:(4-(4-[2-(gamma-L-glutamylamino)ethyl]phenoxymethyl)furan-2-yl)methanamine synthase
VVAGTWQSRLSRQSWRWWQSVKQSEAVNASDIIGWDVGGAHVKAARLQGAALVDVVQWPCPLWQGLSQLAQVLDQAQQRWPDLALCQHAVTMTGEMVDCFEHREDGVHRIATLLAQRLPAPHFYTHDSGWCQARDAAARWQHIASANWLATASHCAQARPQDEGLLIDVGSTTTDLVAFRQGQVLTAQRSDVQRLASGELVYQGVVRTPLCALAQRVPWRGELHNVMNEFFATTADVYRLSGELAAEHDQHPSADGASKDSAHTHARLARMVGLDARDGTAAEWLAFAQAWRAAQVAELRGQLRRVVSAHALGPQAWVVAAGCGAFLVADLCSVLMEGDQPESSNKLAHDMKDQARLNAAPAAPRSVSCTSLLAPGAAAHIAAWAVVAAPAVAVARLLLNTQRGLPAGRLDRVEAG